MKTVNKRPKILVVDDEEVIREFSKRVLEKLDLEINTANDGKVAWEMVKHNEYHLILLDLIMPVMSGKQFLLRIKRMSRCPPVIVMTGYGTEEVISDIRRLGVFDLMTKPIDVYELRRTVAQVLIDTGTWDAA
ncbi:MAG: response regulator [Candidatus Omnitrophica bacterium]|nr:response regulator [Candidatus Omnitrophota bacterium]